MPMSNQRPSSTIAGESSRGPLSSSGLIDRVDDAGELAGRAGSSKMRVLMTCEPANISASPRALAEAGDRAVLEVDRREAIVLAADGAASARRVRRAPTRVAQRVPARELHRVAVDEKELLLVLELRPHAADRRRRCRGSLPRARSELGAVGYVVAQIALDRARAGDAG